MIELLLALIFLCELVGEGETIVEVTKFNTPTLIYKTCVEEKEQARNLTIKQGIIYSPLNYM